MSTSTEILVRSATAADREWLTEQLMSSWGSTTMVSRGRRHDASQLPALIALLDGTPVGYATVSFAAGDCELLTIEALRRRAGVGSALLTAVIAQATGRGCHRLWLVTTNDNLDAIRFYQRRGMRLVAVHAGAVDHARELKPSIPLVGEYGIALHDELEFELPLVSGRA